MRTRWRSLAAGAALAGAALVAPALAQAQAVRPDVGKPLQTAQQLIGAQRFKEALAKVREADNVAHKTANETLLIERMRISAASGAGDTETAARSFELVGAQLPAPERLRVLEALAGGFYRAKDYARALQWGQRYLKEGGTSASVRTLLVQSQYLSGDFAGAARELRAEIEQTEKAGAAPAEDRLNLLRTAALKADDNAGYAWALERLVMHHPKKEYWADLLARVQRRPGFSNRLALDAYRLSLATGTLAAANDYMEMAQLALQAGFPSEARQVVDKGFAAGVLGTGAQAERHKRLRDLVAKRLEEHRSGQAARLAQAQSAKDGGALVDAGLDLVFAGQAAQGLPLMQEGLAKGKLQRVDDARLHLAVAQLVAGENAKAQATLRSVGGSDGTADLARLWLLHARHK